MEVILLERVAKLGQIGEVVRVRNGFARNFLLPQGKALRATKENREKFEQMKSGLEARNLEKKSEAEAAAKKLDGQSFVLLRQAGEGGQLYGSVSTRDIAALMNAGGFSVERGQIVLNAPIKTIGLFKLQVALHPEVEVAITVNVARTEDEAARQARGEDLTVARSEEEEARTEARVAAGKFFEAPPEEMAEGEPSARKPRVKRAKKGAGEAEASAPAEGQKPAEKPAKDKPAREKKEKKPKA